MSRTTFALQPRQAVATLSALRSPPAATMEATRPASGAGEAASVRRPTVASTTAAVAGRPPAASPPLSSSAAASSRAPAAVNAAPPAAGAGAASPASSPPPPAHVVAAALVPELRPVKQVADIGPVVAPEKYDADLEGKSDYVKKTVSCAASDRHLLPFCRLELLCWAVMLPNDTRTAAACLLPSVLVNYHAR